MLSVEVSQGQFALVAQLDRVFDYESKGRGFESLQPYHVGVKFALLRRLFYLMAGERGICLIFHCF